MEVKSTPSTLGPQGKSMVLRGLVTWLNMHSLNSQCLTLNFIIDFSYENLNGADFFCRT